VVVNDHRDAQSLSRGLSATAEAHLVTRESDWLTSEAVRLRSDELGALQQAHLQQEGQRPAADWRRSMS
jgi:hypothetical protein